MKPQNKILNNLGLVLFFTFILLGIIFFAGLVWPNMESNFYFGFNQGAETKLQLFCPHILTPQDSSSITASVTNKVDQPISPTFQALISGPVFQNVQTQPSIDPGQTLKVKWPVNGDNIIFGHLIIARVYQSSSYKTSTATANCGTLFLNLSGLTGTQIYVGVLVISLLGSTLGLILWAIANRPLGGRSLERLWGLILLGAVVVLGILLGTLGQWLLGTFAFFFSVLMFIILVSRRSVPA